MPTFRIKTAVDSRSDHSALVGFVNNWHTSHGGEDMMVVRQQQKTISESCLIPTQAMTLVDCTQGDLDLYLPNPRNTGVTKQICWTSASRVCGHRVILHTYRGSCVLPKGTVSLIFHKDSWDSLHSTEPLVWYVNRQFGNKLQGQGVVTPYTISSDPTIRAMRNLLHSRGKLPSKRNIGQGCSVAMSADGNTWVVGGCNDDYWIGSVGAVWVFVRTPMSTSCPEVSNALKNGGNVTSSEAAAYNRLWHSMVLQTTPENTVLDGIQKTDVDKNLPVAGSPWMEASKLVGDSVVNFNSSQGFSVAINGTGSLVMSGGPTQNFGQGGIWWFQRSDGDTFVQQSTYTMNRDSLGLSDTSYEMVGCSVSMQAFGEWSAASGKGIVLVFQKTLFAAALVHDEWLGHVLTVHTNDSHLLVGCADTSTVYVVSWASLTGSLASNAPDVRTASFVQVLKGPEDSAHGPCVSSTWQPRRMVVGAHRSSFLSGACHVFDWSKATKQYEPLDVLQDKQEVEIAQGCAVAISGQDGTTITVGSMLKSEETGSIDQWVWDNEEFKFLKQPKSLVPSGVQEGAMVGCSVACSGRGDVVVVGCPADSEFGSAAVFQ